MLGQSNFFLFTSRITRDRFEVDQMRASAYGHPVFERREYAGELPREFISFHCLENKSNVLKGINTEGTENFPELPQTSEVETVIVAETENSPTKSLVVIHVAAVGECAANDDVDNGTKCVSGASHECL